MQCVCLYDSAPKDVPLLKDHAFSCMHAPSSMFLEEPQVQAAVKRGVQLEWSLSL